jgi:hypothetical protein
MSKSSCNNASSLVNFTNYAENDTGMGILGLRKTLKLGSLIFGLSSIFLIFLPNAFLYLLNLSSNEQMRWAMRMIGITVFALAGNMWQNASQDDEKRLTMVGRVMCLCAALLGLLTLLIPTTLSWFAYLYAAIGFGFALSYLLNLIYP